jgi:hypothetical protein
MSSQSERKIGRKLLYMDRFFVVLQIHSQTSVNNMLRYLFYLFMTGLKIVRGRQNVKHLFESVHNSLARHFYKPFFSESLGSYVYTYFS